jgi:uncharacterized protein
MQTTILGRTGLTVSRSAFGAIPIQRISFDESKALLRKAYEGGINFFDTAHGYTDSEEKIGNALSDVRKNIIISTKSQAQDKKTLLEHIELSLSRLKTEYIDVMQLHNPKVLPNPDDPDSTYAALIEARNKGMIRFFGVTNHRFEQAVAAVESPLYDTVQYPLNYLSSEEELTLPALCEKHNKGLIVMKALSGGLITNASTTFAHLRQYKNAVPIWGIEKEHELDEFLSLEKNSPSLDGEMKARIETDRKELSGSFCRGCGYCLPCPSGIEINMAARLMFLIKRSRYQNFITDEWKKKMELIDTCIHCGQCIRQCPYELNPPELLKKQLVQYREFVKTAR